MFPKRTTVPIPIPIPINIQPTVHIQMTLTVLMLFLTETHFPDSVARLSHGRGLCDVFSWFRLCILGYRHPRRVPIRMHRKWASPTLSDVTIHHLVKVSCSLGKLGLYSIGCFINCFFTEQPITNVWNVLNLLTWTIVKIHSFPLYAHPIYLYNSNF